MPQNIESDGSEIYIKTMIEMVDRMEADLNAFEKKNIKDLNLNEVNEQIDMWKDTLQSFISNVNTLENPNNDVIAQKNRWLEIQNKVLQFEKRVSQQQACGAFFSSVKRCFSKDEKQQEGVKPAFKH